VQTEPQPTFLEKIWLYIGNFLPKVRKLPFEQRREIIKEISESSTPGFDFFLLVILSTSISTLGLITDSPAVIIGAMLIAPLMSPIIGIGLASIIGSEKLLKDAGSALIRGALLAIFLAAIITVINSYLPFVSFQELPKEILSRTHPSPLDLMIAFSGGLAAAYSLTQPNLSAALPGVAIATALMPPLSVIGIGIALGRWDVAGGAGLLFTTNAVTIAFASALVFFLRGFNPYPSNGVTKLPRNLKLSAIVTGALLIPLTYASIQFVTQASQNRLINTVVQEEIQKVNNAELVELNITRNGETLEIDVTIRTNSALHYEQVVGLQQAIVDRLNQPVSLKVNQIFAERLDPLIPPTATSTPTITSTPTAGPSPTITNSPTPTPTGTATFTPTPMPTSTPTPTATPAQAVVLNNYLPAIRLYQEPGGPSIGTLRLNQILTVLYGTQIKDGLVWVQIKDSEGRIGWIPQIFLRMITLTPSVTPTITKTPPPVTITPTLSATLSQ